MPIRNTEFANGEYYHVFNRGVDKRRIFEDEKDLGRFMQGILEFNNVNLIGSILQKSFNKNKKENEEKPLVGIVAYCINPNHFHFLLVQKEETGVQKFMHRMSLGYSKYFNEKYGRKGALFGGRFKAKHIKNDAYLLHLSSYINLNFLVHKITLGLPESKFVRSSWKQYSEELNGEPLIQCEKDIILGQFKDKKAYKDFAEGNLPDMIARKEEINEEI